MHRQSDDLGRGCHIGGFAPKQVALFVGAAGRPFSFDALIGLNLERPLIHVLWKDRTEGIVAIDVYMGGFVFPIDIVGRTPAVVRRIERVADIVALVAAW